MDYIAPSAGAAYEGNIVALESQNPMPDGVCLEGWTGNSKVEIFFQSDIFFGLPGIHVDNFVVCMHAAAQ